MAANAKRKKSLTTRSSEYTITEMCGYSTAQAAKLVGISKNTLLRWLYEGSLREPKRRMGVGGSDWRVWSEADVERARTVKATMKRGPKPKSKK